MGQWPSNITDNIIRKNNILGKEQDQNLEFMEHKLPLLTNE